MPFDHRQFLNSDAKANIAEQVAKLIPDGASVFLGIGTTVEYVAKALVSHHGLQVFTNNLTVASILGQHPGVRVRVLAGKLRHQHYDLVGEDTLSGLRQYYFDYGVLGCGGMDEAQGILDFDPDEAAVSRVLVEQSRYSLLVADRHKWGRKAMARVTPFSSIDWLFSDVLTHSQTDLLTAHGVQIQLCS
nr:DeoR/GlpR transcriptional regulator [Marinomonas algarum]